MTSATHSENGYLLCPECGKENQRISPQSPLEYATHPKCHPAYKAAQHAKFKRLRERTAQALLLAAVLVQYAPGPGQPVPFDPYARQVPPSPPLHMEPYRQPSPPTPPLQPTTPLPPLTPGR